MKRYYSDILFFLMGVLVFSSLSSTLAIRYFKLPLSMPELFFIPFIFLLGKKIRSIRLKGLEILSAFMLVGFFTLIGILYGDFSFSSILSLARSWAYLFLGFLAFSRINQIDNTDWMWLCLGSLLAWAIDSLLNYQNLIVGIRDGDFVVTYGLMLSVPLFFSIVLYRKRYYLLSIGLSVLFVAVLFSGIRRLLVIALFSLFVAIILSLKKNKTNILHYIFIGMIFISTFVYIMPFVRDTMERQSYSMYYRIFVKTAELGEGTLSGDAARQNNFVFLVDNLVDYTIPRGMVSVRTGSDKGTGVFNDFPLYQLCWIFGWPIAFFIVFYIGFVIIKNYSKYCKLKDETSMLSICGLLIILILLWLDGTYIEYPYATPITGAIIGRATLNAKIKSIIK